jgi:hypothetical protein
MAKDGRQKAEDGRRKAEDGRRKAEGGRRKAEDGRRKAEDGRRKAEDGRTLKRSPFRFSVFCLLSSVFLSVLPGCGKKGPPLAPLNLAPEAPGTVVARRLGDSVYLQMKVPAKSSSGTGPYSIDRIDVYAVTLAPGTMPPPNRDLLKPEHVVARIAVAPPVDPDAEEPAVPEKRPRPGDTISFVEKLTPEALVPQQITKPVKEAKGGKPLPPPPLPPPLAAPGGEAAAPAPVGPLVLTRVYVLQGVSKKRQVGVPSARLEVPLLAAPGPARPGATPPTWDETSVTISWQPPASASDEVPGVVYNVYAVPAAGGSPPSGASMLAPVPLNATVLETTTFVHKGAEPGKEQCFVVRSVAPVGTAFIESDPSEPICVTPRDTFPPAAPKSLQSVGSAGVINLIWDANTETDVAGYLVLRGEAPGDTLQALTPEPIKDTRYQDRAIKPGVTYVYAIVAVDRATPPNKSAESNRVQETAR